MPDGLQLMHVKVKNMSPTSRECFPDFKQTENIKLDQVKLSSTFTGQKTSMTMKITFTARLQAGMKMALTIGIGNLSL